MTDKELIKQEIERRIDLYSIAEKDDLTFARMGELSGLIDFIDSLPEEHASEDLTHAAYHYANNLHTKRQIQLFEEKDVAADFIAGAEWQHGKDFDDLLQSEMKFPKEFYEKGRSDMKEEIMKDAVESTVKYEIGSAEIPQCDKRYQVLSDPTPIANAKLGEKVKIIIVKPEQQ